MQWSGASRRRWVLVGAAAVLAVIVLASWRLGIVWPSGGPLHWPGNFARTNVRGASDVTAVFSLADSEIDAPVELRSIEVVGADASLKLGTPRMIVCENEGTCVLPFFHRRWPPRGTVLQDADGYVVDGTGNTLVGVRIGVPDEPGRYGLRGLLVDYTSGVRRFRAEVGPNMTFVVRDRSPAG